jgi:hypothetical protein
VEERLLWLLDHLRGRAEEAKGYGPANLVALLRVLRGDLRGLDLSRLALRGVSLQGVEMQDATLSGSLLRETVFTEAFDTSWAVAISSTGQYWAAGSRRGEVRVWREEGKMLHLAWQAHSDTVRALAFSPVEIRSPRGAGMGPSSCGTWSAVPCSGRTGIATTSIASPLLPMEARSPAAEMMRPFASGTPRGVRACRRSPASAARCMRWPGVPMGACSPVGTSMEAFGCGRCGEGSQKPLCGCSWGIRIG